MESSVNKLPKSKKTPWLVGSALVAILAVVYFSFFYPPTPADDATGTIGAATKYRSEQISEGDVQLAGQETAGGGAAVAANVEAFDRIAVDEKTELVSKQALEAREAIFARFSFEHASAILDRTAPEALRTALEGMSAAGRTSFFSKMDVLDRSTLALRSGAAELNAAYAKLDASAKATLAEKFSSVQFENKSIAERVKIFEGMTPAEKFATLKTMPVDAAVALAERVAPDALMKTFLKAPLAEQHAMVGKAPMNEKMIVYSAIPIEAKTLAFAKLPIDQQKSAYDRLPVESKQALLRTLSTERTTEMERTAIEGKTAPAQE